MKAIQNQQETIIKATHSTEGVYYVGGGGAEGACPTDGGTDHTSMKDSLIIGGEAGL